LASKTHNLGGVFAMRESMKSRSVEAVFDTPRSKDQDVLFLRNGDTLGGSILNTDFSVRTPYSSIHISSNRLAGICFGTNKNYLGTVVAINNDSFSGFIDESVIMFLLNNGTQLEIRKEIVHKLVLRLSSQGTFNIPWRQFFCLKNGDIFHGAIKSTTVSLFTDYSKIMIDCEDIDVLETSDNERYPVRIDLIDGTKIRGVLEIDDLDIELDIGSEVTVYKELIEKIYFREGSVLGDSGRSSS